MERAINGWRGRGHTTGGADFTRDASKMLAGAKLPRQGLPPRRSLAAVFGPRCIDLPVDDDVVAEHAHEGLCPGVAACGVPGVHGAAHIPGVTDASPALAEIHDAGRRPELVDRTLRIADRVGQVGLDLVLVVIGQRTDRSGVSGFARV